MAMAVCEELHPMRSALRRSTSTGSLKKSVSFDETCDQIFYFETEIEVTESLPQLDKQPLAEPLQPIPETEADDALNVLDESDNYLQPGKEVSENYLSKSNGLPEHSAEESEGEETLAENLHGISIDDEATINTCIIPELSKMANGHAGGVEIDMHNGSSVSQLTETSDRTDGKLRPPEEFPESLNSRIAATTEQNPPAVMSSKTTPAPDLVAGLKNKGDHPDHGGVSASTIARLPEKNVLITHSRPGRGLTPRVALMRPSSHHASFLTTRTQFGQHPWSTAMGKGVGIGYLGTSNALRRNVNVALFQRMTAKRFVTQGHLAQTPASRLRIGRLHPNTFSTL